MRGERGGEKTGRGSRNTREQGGEKQSKRVGERYWAEEGGGKERGGRDDSDRKR